MFEVAAGKRKCNFVSVHVNACTCAMLRFINTAACWYLSNIINNTSYVSVLCFSGRVTEQCWKWLVNKTDRERDNVLLSSVNKTDRLDLLQARQHHVTFRDHKFT